MDLMDFFSLLLFHSKGPTDMLDPPPPEFPLEGSMDMTDFLPLHEFFSDGSSGMELRSWLIFY